MGNSFSASPEVDAFDVASLQLEHYGHECLYDWGRWYAKDNRVPGKKDDCNLLYGLMRSAEGYRYRDEGRTSEPLDSVAISLVHQAVLVTKEPRHMHALNGFYVAQVDAKQIGEFVLPQLGFKAVTDKTVKSWLTEERKRIARIMYAAEVVG